MFGGAGFNSMELKFLDKYGLPHGLRAEFVRSCRRLATVDVDIFLGNHVGNNDTLGKWAKKKETGENPFLGTDGEWKRFLRAMEEKMIAKILAESPDELPEDLR
jgi:hypothetical protein